MGEAFQVQFEPGFGYKESEQKGHLYWITLLVLLGLPEQGRGRHLQLVLQALDFNWPTFSIVSTHSYFLAVWSNTGYVGQPTPQLDD